jgi:fumarate reductase subunit D
MARSNEPLWWVPFMAGAGASAFLMPITIVITSIAVGLGWITWDQMYRLLNNPLVRIYLVVLISLSLFHAAHRLRFVLIDLLTPRGALSLICYGSAIVGTVVVIIFAAMM